MDRLIGDITLVTEKLGLTKQRCWRLRKEYPDFPVIRVGARLLYDIERVRKWMNENLSNEQIY